MVIKFALVAAMVAFAAVEGGSTSHAHSFSNFHGPVVGPAEEVSLHGKHGHGVDYVAHPHYGFSYGVEDRHTGDYHGQKEHRDGKDVVGEYTVKEPGGNLRVVKYHADPKGGFFAHVHNSNGNNHEGGTYGGHGGAGGGQGHGFGHGGAGGGLGHGFGHGGAGGGLGHGSGHGGAGAVQVYSYGHDGVGGAYGFGHDGIGGVQAYGIGHDGAGGAELYGHY